jgi:hypothetical protein
LPQSWFQASEQPYRFGSSGRERANPGANR